jgi:hypothetical protein
VRFRRRHRRIFSWRRDGWCENLAGDAFGASQRHCDYDHPRKEVGRGNTDESTANGTGGTIIAVVYDRGGLPVEEVRDTRLEASPKTVRLIEREHGWVVLDVIHLLESGRNFEERRVEKAFLELSHMHLYR